MFAICLFQPVIFPPVENENAADMRRANQRDLDLAVSVKILGTYRIEPAVGQPDRCGFGEDRQAAVSNAHDGQSSTSV